MSMVAGFSSSVHDDANRPRVDNSAEATAEVGKIQDRLFEPVFKCLVNELPFGIELLMDLGQEAAAAEKVRVPVLKDHFKVFNSAERAPRA